MEETISLKEIFHTLKKRVALILIITLLATAVSAFVTYFFMTPKYDATTQILVNQNTAKDNLYSTNAVQTNIQLVNTYTEIIYSTPVLNQVIKDLHLNMDASELEGLITTNTEENSQVFSLTAETDSPSESAKIANGVATAFKAQVPKMMNVNNVTVLSKAQPDYAPVKPKPLMNIAIAFIVGLMVSIGIAFLLEYLDNTIKTEDDIEKVLSLPVLGAVARIDTPHGQSAKQAHPAHQKARGGHVEA